MENEENDVMSMWNVDADNEETESTIVESMTRSLSEQVGEGKLMKRGCSTHTGIYLRVESHWMLYKRESIDDSIWYISKQKKGFAVHSL